MYLSLSNEIAAQHVADLHREAARERLVRQLRASRTQAVRRRRVWERLVVRRPQPAA